MIYGDVYQLLLHYPSTAYLVTDKVKKFHSVAAKMRSHMPLQLHQSECVAILKLPQVVVKRLSRLTADFVANQVRL